MIGATIAAEPFTRMPERFYANGRTSTWVDANKPGASVPSFLEGPSFDREGNLWLADIPWGRIFSISADGEWSLRAEYDGWPNGLKIHRDGSIWIADHKCGILRLDPSTGVISEVFGSARSEGFKGCNDLFFAADGTLFFTDQGQTGLHDPTGRVFRAPAGTQRLEKLLTNGPSPNGLVTGRGDAVLFVAMTRAAEVWRVPLFPEGPSKVGLFARLPAGTSGPDGMALDEAGNLYVCHASRGRVFVYGPHGDDLFSIDCSHIGRTVTNLAFAAGDMRTVYVTVSDAGVVARATVPHPGRTMFSHLGQ
jgi:gluconolactonase